MSSIYMLEVNQPIGTFYIGSLKAVELLSITKTIRRGDGKGVQRELSKDRVRGIQQYCQDPDATFPTPIILAIETTGKTYIRESKIAKGIYEFVFNDTSTVAEILDGQHRIEGIRSYQGINELELPIVIMCDLTEEEKAYVFSTINSNQVKVDKSLIYDLFELSEKRSPYKTCHEIARILNSKKGSPFYRRLKMLGKKGNDTESLSQGTFVECLCSLMSRTPREDMIKIKNGESLKDDSNYPLRKYFLSNDDAVILKIIENMFTAVEQVFFNEWNQPEKYILCKTTGYGALMKALKEFYVEGMQKGDLTASFFQEKLLIFRAYLANNELELTSEYFKSNEQVQKQLSQMILGKY